MTAPEIPDLPRIADTLARHHVEYLFVGGIAARAYGARRVTYDVDCVPQRSRDNLERLADALRELNARLRVGGLSDEEAARLPVKLAGSTLARMEISTWRTDAGDLDILADIPDRDGRHLTYSRLAARAAELNLDGIAVRVAALDDVIASKEWATARRTGTRSTSFWPSASVINTIEAGHGTRGSSSGLARPTTCRGLAAAPVPFPLRRR